MFLFGYTFNPSHDILGLFCQLVFYIFDYIDSRYINHGDQMTSFNILQVFESTQPYQPRTSGTSEKLCTGLGTLEDRLSQRVPRLILEIILPNYMAVSLNGGTPKSSILIEFAIINHPFWGIPLFFGNTHMGIIISN